MTRPVCVDLFAGAGGFSLGFEQAGFDIPVAVEYDPVHAATHAFNFPLTDVLGVDVRKLSPAEVLTAATASLARYRGAVPSRLDIDVVIGGPPCQGFSTIGRRRVDDDRNELVFSFLDLVGQLRPRYFVLENVPGIAAGPYRGLIERLTEGFRDHGYEPSEPRNPECR